MTSDVVMPITGFIDNRLYNQRTTFMGLPVYSFNDLKDLEFDYLGIWAENEAMWKDVYAYLVEKLGVSNSKIIDVFTSYKKKLVTKYSGLDGTYKDFVETENRFYSFLCLEISV